MKGQVVKSLTRRVRPAESTGNTSRRERPRYMSLTPLPRYRWQMMMKRSVALRGRAEGEAEQSECDFSVSADLDREGGGIRVRSVQGGRGNGVNSTVDELSYEGKSHFALA